jgi:hypothetical protein
MSWLVQIGRQALELSPGVNVQLGKRCLIRNNAPGFRCSGARSCPPALASDPQRNNNFDYGKMDPHGYAVPLGVHIRRMNPRDTAVNVQRRRMIRRGATYGPPFPEGMPDDGVERGVAAFVLCASLVRQFEFAQNVWINDPSFMNSGTSVTQSSATRTAALI